MNVLVAIIVLQFLLLLVLIRTSPRAQIFIASAGAVALLILAAPLLAPFYLIDRLQRRRLVPAKPLKSAAEELEPRRKAA